MADKPAVAATAATKQSKRHSAEDQTNLDKAANHLMKAGAAMPDKASMAAGTGDIPAAGKAAMDGMQKCPDCGAMVKPVMKDGKATCPECGADMSAADASAAKRLGARYVYKRGGQPLPGSAKSVDLDEWTSRVRGEFYEEFASGSPYGPVNNWWVERVYDDAVIVCTGEEYYRVPYTLTGTDVEFASIGQWQQVVRAYTPVADTTVAAGADTATGGGDMADMKGVKSDDTLVNYGGTLKAVGDKFAGLLVKYSTENDPDLTGDYFTKDTEFGVDDGAPSPMYFHHRLPIKGRGGKEIRIKTKIGAGIIKFHEDGVYLEDVILFNRTEYEKAIEKSAKAGKLGLSSGTASHFVEREFTGKAYKITEWLLGIDASVTPTPAEPRTHISPVKSLPALQLDFDIPDPEAISPEGAATTAPVSGAAVNNDGTGAAAPHVLENDMTPEELKALMDGVAGINTSLVSQAEEIKALKAKWNEPPTNGGALATTLAAQKAAPAHKTPLGDGAELAFEWYLKTGDAGGIRTGEAYQQMRAENAMKTTYSLLEGTQYQGQEAVPTEVVHRIIERRDQISVMRQAGAQVIPVGSNAVVLPIEKASPEVFVITSEGGTFDQTTTQPMDKLSGTIYQFTKTVPISTQLLEDSVVGIEAWWGRRLARAWALTENKYFLTGTGSGQPQGVVVGGTSAFTSASGLALTAGELVKLYYSLAQEYRDNVSWSMSGASEATVRQLGAPTYGFAFVGNGGFNGGAGGGGGATGRWIVDPQSKVFNGSDHATIGVNNKPIVVMNAEAGYVIFERKGLTVFRDPYTLATSGEVNIIAYFRETGGVSNAAAVEYVTMASA